MPLAGAVVIVAAVVLLLLVLVILACKPWWLFSRSRYGPIKADDSDKPLISDEVVLIHAEGGVLGRDSVLEGPHFQSESQFSSSHAPGLSYKHKSSSDAPPPAPGDGLTLDVISEHHHEFAAGNTLKRPLTSCFPEEKRPSKRDVPSCDDLKISLDSLGDEKVHLVARKDIFDQRSCLSLEVVSGPSRGLCYCIKSTDTSRLPFTVGRVSPSDLLLKDSEVSGKHALVSWNLDKMKWEMVDMGSLNGTFLNSHAVHDLESGNRRWGNPTELENGDVITFGTTSKIHVQITSEIECTGPFRIGVAVDPMALHRGGKKLPMEDACFCEWPLRGANQFGLFGICDGHGGAEAAKSASKILPEVVASILREKQRKERVISEYDASNVLREAFSQTEACLDHYYEGCTATVLLVWADSQENYCAQCANVGDSACVISIDGKLIKMTEDHRISCETERLRINRSGERLKDGETRLCGINIGRMLGDKFLKQLDSRFSSEPYISQVVHLNTGFALLASDGLWDVMGVRKATQIVLQVLHHSNCTTVDLVAQMKEKYGAEGSFANMVASYLLSEARTLRTKDNTSVIFIEFDGNTGSCK